MVVFFALFAALGGDRGKKDSVLVFQNTIKRRVCTMYLLDTPRAQCTLYVTITPVLIGVPELI